MNNRGPSYWAGLATGILTGVVASFWLQILYPRNKQTSAHTMLNKDQQSPAEKAGLQFVSRRDSPESAGDPTAVTSPTSATSFDVRPGGAPGPRQQGELLNTPGRPGQQIDHADSSQGVQVSSRTLNLGNKPACPTFLKSSSPRSGW
jgi:hypothetical protein